MTGKIRMFLYEVVMPLTLYAGLATFFPPLILYHFFHVDSEVFSYVMLAGFILLFTSFIIGMFGGIDYWADKEFGGGGEKDGFGEKLAREFRDSLLEDSVDFKPKCLSCVHGKWITSGGFLVTYCNVHKDVICDRQWISRSRCSNCLCSDCPHYKPRGDDENGEA